MLALDGVYVRDAQGGELVFHALAVPTADGMTDVATRTAERVQKVLARHGRSLDGTGEPDAAEPVGELLALSALCAAAAAGHGLAGDRAGEPLLRVVTHVRARPSAWARVAASTCSPRSPSHPRPRPARAPLPLRLPSAHRASCRSRRAGSSSGSRASPKRRVGRLVQLGHAE